MDRDKYKNVTKPDLPEWKQKIFVKKMDDSLKDSIDHLYNLASSAVKLTDPELDYSRLLRERYNEVLSKLDTEREQVIEMKKTLEKIIYTIMFESECAIRVGLALRDIVSETKKIIELK
jgi:hypothetical protein